MDDVTERPIAERVRTVLARGAAGTVGSGLLTRPLTRGTSPAALPTEVPGQPHPGEAAWW